MSDGDKTKPAFVRRKHKLPRFEYRFADIHTGVSGSWGYQINALGRQGWRVNSFERHTDAHVWVLFEREIVDDDDDGRDDRDADHG